MCVCKVGIHRFWSSIVAATAIVERRMIQIVADKRRTVIDSLEQIQYWNMCVTNAPQTKDHVLRLIVTTRGVEYYNQTFMRMLSFNQCCLYIETFCGLHNVKFCKFSVRDRILTVKTSSVQKLKQLLPVRPCSVVCSDIALSHWANNSNISE
jgi:hypothetical protein